MAITLNNADEALKSYYLDAVSEELNSGVNPFYAMIEKSTNDVYGKEVVKLVEYGLNGGIGAGTETGSLPVSVENKYKQLKLELKNLYGTIEISDKAIRASENSVGAFVNLLNAEMEGLIKSSKFNFGRMLFGDGTGSIAKVVSVEDGVITVDSVKNIVQGMCIDFCAENGSVISSASKRVVLGVDKATKKITVSGVALSDLDVPANSIITMQGSYDNELTGLGAIFGDNETIYGVERSGVAFLNPYKKALNGEITELAIQTAIDEIEENANSKVNVIICSWGVRRSLQALLSKINANIETQELAGGYKTISYNGIPVIADRFCPEGTMYLLNTNDFCLHQLCDWQWLEGENGKILNQIANKPIYTATLVKYADLMCSRPIGQGVITGITEI